MQSKCFSSLQCKQKSSSQGNIVGEGAEFTFPLVLLQRERARFLSPPPSQLGLLHRVAFHIKNLRTPFRKPFRSCSLRIPVTWRATLFRFWGHTLLCSGLSPGYCSGITPGSLQGPYVVPGIRPRSVSCKAKALPAVLSFCSLDRDFIQFSCRLLELIMPPDVTLKPCADGPKA